MFKSAQKPLVTITGVSGYLGSQTALTFLKYGSYRVRGTVRSTTNEAKINPLKASFGEHFNEMELVEADLMNEASIIDACAGSSYVVHTASPLSFTQKEEDLIKTAVDSTTAVLKASTQHKVKRLVITSAMAAISGKAKEDRPPKDLKWNESHWSNPERPEGMSGYSKSKTLAERTAWDY